MFPGRCTAGVTGVRGLGTVSGSFDLTARLEPRSAGAAGGLRVVTSADGGEYLDLRPDPASGDLVVDRDHAALDPRAHGGSHRVPHRRRALADRGACRERGRSRLAVSAWDLRPYTVRSLAGAGSGPADAGLVRP
ncbi:GH32 C-terminal domain-containing protein [Streptomyces sp. NPDC000877]|uniref:GH32 C-terminal domain-containing protein n=1 Tax=unclassified Streptomyces TaxID=2593676 RepID=UPI0033177DB6